MNDIIIYQNGEIELNVSIQNESIWLTQKQIAELFNVKVPAISKHIKNIFAQNELIENMVVLGFAIHSTVNRVTPPQVLGGIFTISTRRT